MDRRYVLIIFIIVICCFNLYFITEHSNVVGSASADFREVTFSLPPQFNIVSSNNKYVQIFNPDFGYINIAYSDVNTTANYDNRIQLLKNSSNDKILSNGSITYKNISVDSVYFINNDSDGVENNQSAFYFIKDNLLFRIEMITFDMDNRNSTIENLKFIIDSIRFNHKVND